MAGSLNVLITNIILQLLLYIEVFSITISTLISQVINMLIGYFLYGSYVFNEKNLNQAKNMWKYLFAMTCIWIINAVSINVAILFDISKNLAALILVPILATISYIFNKWVFNVR